MSVKLEFYKRLGNDKELEDDNNFIEKIELQDYSNDSNIKGVVPPGSDISDNEGDKSLLIGSHDDGVYNDYEVVLSTVGFGLFHLLFIAGFGLANGADAIEILSISYTLPFLRLPTELGIIHWQTGLLSSAIFLGLLIGGYVWGGLADITGRRLTLMMSLFVNSIFAFASAFSPNFYVLLILRFFSGIGVGGSLPVIGPYVSEFVEARYRGSYLGIYGGSWIVGAVFCGGMAWALLPHQSSGLQIGDIPVHIWRVFLFICAIPSLVGAIVFIFMPESPRYLLEVKKEKDALNVLKCMYYINNFWKNKPFPIKRIQIEGLTKYKSDPSIKSFFRKLPKNFVEILKRTSKLYRTKNLLRPTLLLMIIYTCLSFGSYGVTFWFPSYIDQLTQNKQATPINAACNGTLANTTQLPSDNYLCHCPLTHYINVTVDKEMINKWWVWNATFTDTSLLDGHYKRVWFESMIWKEILIHNVTFDQMIFYNSTWKSVSLVNVTFNNSILCGISAEVESMSLKSVHFIDTVINGQKMRNFPHDLVQDLFNSSTWNDTYCLTNMSSPSCVEDDISPDYKTEYFHDFIITSSGLIGIVISSIAVYFLLRSFLLAFSLGVSAMFVFLLYIVHTEIGAVIILSIFKTISLPCWNITTIIVADLYPTSLRSTASGVHLLMVRIGAIVGTYTFGMFSYSSLTVPVLTTAGLLSIGAFMSLFLPWSTRMTALK